LNIQKTYVYHDIVYLLQNFKKYLCIKPFFAQNLGAVKPSQFQGDRRSDKPT